MKEAEVKRKSLHWQLILAFCLVSLAAVSCGSIEKNFKPTPTVPPTPTTFPAYKYYFPIPEVKQFTDSEKICEQKHFETYQTFGTIQGSYHSDISWPNSQAIEITYRQYPRATLETTALILPATPQLVLDMIADDLDQITNRQLTPACDKIRILAQWAQNGQIDNLYFADIENRKLLPIKKNSRLAEAIIKLVELSFHPNQSDYIPIPMQIVP